MSILNKLYIHPFTYLLIILSFITGMFKEFGMVMFIIIIHELGHLSASRVFKWNFDKIAIYPFGGCCKFDEKVNRPMKEELIILISGPLFQIILFFIIVLLNNKGIIGDRNFSIFKTYHYTLLFFNLLPIYPLDGGRILNLVLQYMFPFKKANKLIITLSFFIVLIMMLFYKNLNFTLMSVLLGIELFIYLKRQGYLYNEMLLERYINKYSFKKEKIINNKNNMYKDKRHIILYKNKYLTEKEYLNKRFRVRY